MNKIIFLILIFFSCVMLNGYRDYNIESLSSSDFSVGIKSAWNGDYYIIDIDTLMGRCKASIPVEMTYLHKRKIKGKPVIIVISSCGDEEYNFDLCGLNRKTGCNEYHLYIPEDTVIKRLNYKEPI